MPRTPTGIVTRTGPAIRYAGALHPLPKARTPLGRAVALLIARIDAGAVQPCPNCGRFDCGCWEWVELMTAPPPADLNNLTDEDLPY